MHQKSTSCVTLCIRNPRVASLNDAEIPELRHSMNQKSSSCVTRCIRNPRSAPIRASENYPHSIRKKEKKKKNGTRAPIAAHGFRAFTACTTHAPTTSLKEQKKKTEKKRQGKEEKTKTKTKQGKEGKKQLGERSTFTTFQCVTRATATLTLPPGLNTRRGQQRTEPALNPIASCIQTRYTQHNTTRPQDATGPALSRCFV